MSDEVELNSDNPTPITRALSPAQRRAVQRREAKAAFIASLREDPNVSLAADQAGIARDTAYQWREHDASFASNWDTALERAKDVARSSIYRRGILGWDEVVVSMGRVVCEEELLLDDEGKPQFDKRGNPVTVPGKPLTQRKHSDTLAALYAKANLPEYKEKVQLDIRSQWAELEQQAEAELLANLAVDVAHENKEQA